MSNLTPANLLHKQPLPVPYLANTPEVIVLQPGRQLFVDDYLIDLKRTTMSRVFHQPVKHPGNPVIYPETEWETLEPYPPCAVAKCGGVWFDDRDRLFKMWYMGGYLGVMCLATSEDGVHWNRPEFDVVPGTNIILPKDVHPDSGSVIIDHTASGNEPRYKMLTRRPDMPDKDYSRALLYTSNDGIHWDHIGDSGPMDDRSTMFYNPFMQKWAQSIRVNHPVAHRSRYYHDGDSFLESAQWTEQDRTPWLRADSLDSGKYLPAELYNFDAIAYESVMIGFHQILHGPNNSIGEASGLPKLTELYLSTSRDGLHWDRSCRTPLIPARREYGSWEYGYIESSAGMCCIVGDELWLYYSAYAGDPNRITKDWRINGLYANGAVGLAKLRRDGFASLRPGYAGAIARTVRLQFSGKRLFVNANTVGTTLSVEVQNAQGKAYEGLSHEDCIGFCGNSTCTEIQWREKDLSGIGTEGVHLEFRLDRGDFYAFWMTDSTDGKSGGYTAAGGPSLNRGRDI
ncbi:MAG: glycosyl hydrolase family 32 [Puniceicoccales bacterium]